VVAVQEGATFTSKKFSILMAPPSKEDMDRMAAEAKSNAQTSVAESKSTNAV